MLNALVQPTTPSEQVAERKVSIEEITTHFESMEQVAKTIMPGNTVVLAERCSGQTT